MKLLHKKIFFVIFLLSSNVLSAQKNAPVAGDAAQLVDLLKKDYSSIDPSTVDEELIKDRAQVISIFKTYMKEDDRNSLAKTTSQIKTKLETYKQEQQRVSQFLSIAAGSKTVSDAIRIDSELNKLNVAVKTSKENYYSTRYTADNSELINIQSKFNTNNEYIDYVINQFIQKYENISKSETDVFAKSNPNASVQKAIPFIGGDMGFDVIIDGLSKFLAKRIKEELTAHVIDKVKEWLKNPSEDDPIAELKVLLPRTNTYLLNFNSSQITSFPNEIKQYIEDDFNHIIENMAGLKNTPRIKRLVNKYPQVDFALEALELIPNLSKIKDPIDYFEILENSRNLSRWSEDSNPLKFNIANTLKLSSMLAHSLTIIESGQQRLAGTDFFNTYSSDLHFYLLYVGFLHQQNSEYYDIKLKEIMDTDFELKTAMQTLVNIDPAVRDNLITHRHFFETIFKQLGMNSEKVYTSALEIKKANKKGEKIGADTIHTFVKSIINLAEEVTAGGDTLVRYFLKVAKKDEYIKNVHLNKTAAPYYTVAHSTNEIVLDLQKKKYSTALIKTLEVSSKMLPEKLNRSMKFLSNAIFLLPDITAADQAESSKSWIIKDWHAKDWFVLREAFTKTVEGSNFAIDKNVAIQVYEEMIKIRNYHQLRFENDLPAFTDLSIFIQQLNKIKNNGSLNSEECKILLNTLTNLSFRKIVISYYLNIKVDEFAENLKNELKQFTVDINGNATNIFTEAEAESLKNDFLNYINAVFIYLTDNNAMAFNESNQRFKKTVTALLMRAPEKFDIHLSEKVLKLIHFVNDMAVAQNSDDIANAIEAFALPAGSYSIKRNSRFNISLNSFPGILLAGEKTRVNNSIQWSKSFAFTAPIGLSFSFGDNKGISRGLFVPIIDIGAITRMHLDNDDDDTKIFPELSFQSVFSPGAYYHLGFKKTPLSLNIGAQYGPGLKAIDNNGNTKFYESIRVGLGIVLDIPLLNFHTTPRFEGK